jgi:pimeloyl-ACP methyl ester carboxylesterase
MFDAQVQAMKDRYRCVTSDFRGQGQSQVTAGGYDMDTLKEDVSELIERIDCAPCHFFGHSMGGFVGIRLAVHRPELVKSLILVNTSADPEVKANLPRYRLLNFVARWIGPWAVAHNVMRIFFGPNFLSDPTRENERKKWRQNLSANHPIGITRAVTGVITREGVDDILDKIRYSTLIIAGEWDAALPPERSRRMHARIPNSRLVTIPRAGHMAPVEEPEAVNKTLKEFLSCAR